MSGSAPSQQQQASSAAPAGALPAIELGPDGRPVKKSSEEMKKMSKQEKAAYQEAQRAWKAAQSAAPASGGKGAKASAATSGEGRASGAGNGAPATASGAAARRPGTAVSAHQDAVGSQAAAGGNRGASSRSADGNAFSHLPVPISERKLPIAPPRGLHPAVVLLGARIVASMTAPASGADSVDCASLGETSAALRGANARCVAMLEAFRSLINDYSTPQSAVLSRHLTQYLGLHISYLAEIRPLSPGMGSAIRALKHEISVLPPDMSDAEAKASLVEFIDTYVQERIVLAQRAIAQHAAAKIKNGDVILAFGASSAVRGILLAAHAQGKRFQVVILDSRPRNEGRELARHLVNAGVECSYALISALSFAARGATKVLLGANGLLANGALLARAGTAQVALVAARLNLPVIVACETYKFTQTIHLDSITFNELGDPSELRTPPGGASASPAADKRVAPAVNLLFDVTPPEFLTVRLQLSDSKLVTSTSFNRLLRYVT
uniref:Translation initiation factor eIF2B subunit delta n=1 Tax=Hordeum vulgare subsp. vulgare TaxID=112509 RepID=F2E2V2_HORVV|nr:predicted protein [Hordeum vulgare subsp. vulgare]